MGNLDLGMAAVDPGAWRGARVLPLTDAQLLTHLAAAEGLTTVALQEIARGLSHQFIFGSAGATAEIIDVAVEDARPVLNVSMHPATANRRH